MKKIFIIFLSVLLFAAFAGITASAEIGANNIADELEIDTEGIDESLTPEVKDFFEENNISPADPETMTKITPKDVFTYVWEQFKTALKKPIKFFASIMAVIMIAAFIESMEDSMSNKSLSKIFGVICVMVSVGIISGAVSDSLKTAAEALNSGGTFMIGYVPVFAGITASSGSVTSAVSYNMLLLLVAETAVQLSGELIIPVLSICMAMGIVESINPDFHLSGITEAVKNVVTFVLGFVMTIFIGLLSLQSIVGASADTLGVKAAKFMVSNCIPVVGGAIADTYATVKSSLGLLRGGAGFFGIAAIFLIILPPILEIAAVKLMLTAADVVSELFGVSQIKILIKNSNWIMTTAFSLLICFAVMLIISTAVLMLVGLNIS